MTNSAKVTLAASASAAPAKAAKPAKAATAAALAAVRAASASCVISYDTLRKALKAAGGEQEILRAAVIEGALCGSLFAGDTSEDTLAKVRKILSNVGHGATGKPKEGQGRRTAAQETACASARQVWSRLLKKAKVASADKRGGAAGAKAANAAKAAGKRAIEQDAKIVSAPTAPVAPVAVTAQVAREFVAQQAAMLLAYANKNAKVMPIELRNAIGAFVTATKLPEEKAAA